MAGVQATILVIDDDESIREALTDILAIDNIVAITAEDGSAGITQFSMHQDEIQLIMLDLQMPGLNAEETIDGLRSLDADVPVLLSSGFSRAESEKRYPNMRVQGFLQKPYQIQRLLDVVRSLIEER